VVDPLSLTGDFHEGSVSVHAGQIILLDHFRHATRGSHLEIPRGFGADGSSSEESAVRELFEETLSVPTAPPIRLGRVRPDTGQSTSVAELYFAKVTKPANPNEDEPTGDPKLLSVREFEALIRNGEIEDSFTLAAYAMAKLRGLLNE
jgi:ADP-ribose pyrophosphatase